MADNTYEEYEKLVGTSWWYYLISVYLISNFKDSCIFLPVEIEDGKQLVGEIFSLSWFCSSQGCELIPPTIMCRSDKCEKIQSSNIQTGFDNFKKYIEDCVKGSHRLAVIPLALRFSKVGAHSNMLIYDRKLHTLERYEPHGKDTPEIFRPELLDGAISLWFKDNLDSEITYIPPFEYCPNIGPQLVEQSTRENINFKTGLCSLWSFLYALLRLSKPDMRRETINKFLLLQIEKQGFNFLIKILTKMVYFSNKLKTAKNKKDIETVMEEMKQNKFQWS
jgi:hypothetical protein